MVLRSFGLVLGLLIGGVLFLAASHVLAGTGQGWLGHGVLGAGGVFGLWLAVRARRARAVFVGASLTLLGLTAASALVYPALVKSRAEATAGEQKAWCLLAPDTRNGDYVPDKLSYLVAAPLELQDLTWLTLPDPLLLVVEDDSMAAEDLPADGDDPALQVWTLDHAARAFSDPVIPVLDIDRTSMLLDCLPDADPFATGLAPGVRPVTVLWRPVLTGVDGSLTLGPRQRDVFLLPAGSAPLRGSRLSSAEFGLGLDLVPGAAALPVTLRFWSDPADTLRGQLRDHLRDGDQATDFASLPMDALGLHVLEYPSTSSAGATETVSASLAPDGSPQTLITCDEFFCTHHVRPDLPDGLPVVVSITYPVDLRPDWQAIEQAATTQLLAMLESR